MREMGRIYRKVNQGEILAAEGSKRIYILRQIADMLPMVEKETFRARYGFDSLAEIRKTLETFGGDRGWTPDD